MSSETITFFDERETWKRLKSFCDQLNIAVPPLELEPDEAQEAIDAVQTAYRALTGSVPPCTLRVELRDFIREYVHRIVAANNHVYLMPELSPGVRRDKNQLSSKDRAFLASCNIRWEETK